MQITVVQIELISIYELMPKTKNIFVTVIERKPSSNAELKKKLAALQYTLVMFSDL